MYYLFIISIGQGGRRAPSTRRIEKIKRFRRILKTTMGKNECRGKRKTPKGRK